MGCSVTRKVERKISKVHWNVPYQNDDHGRIGPAQVEPHGSPPLDAPAGLQFRKINNFHLRPFLSLYTVVETGTHVQRLKIRIHH